MLLTLRSALARAWPSFNEKRPVFVHGCWRTGSTYVWSKFRQQSQYRAYYEPLHEALLSGTTSEFEAAYANPATFSAMRHPTQSLHYFAEYPLRPDGGVAYFDKSLSYQRYCLDETEQDAVLERYVANLIEFAERHQQRAVLQFNRGLLRSRWLRRKFRSVDILVLRRPWNVWRSFQSFSNRYFCAMVACIIGQNQHHRYFARLANRFEVPWFVGSCTGEDYEHYRSWVEARPEANYSLFFYYYILSLLCNVAGMDVLLDLDAIAASTEVRRQVEGRLTRAGLPLDLSDCKPQDYGCADEAYRQQEAEMLSLLKETLANELGSSRLYCVPLLLNSDLLRALSYFDGNARRAA